MNYLKSITTTVLQSTGVTFPFSIGEKIPGLDGQTIWDVREGVKRVRTLPRSRVVSRADDSTVVKDDQTALTLFIFDSTLPPLQPGNKDRKALFQLAKNALRKLRTIRHPNV
jgi:SCY1-like protein 1